MNAIHLAGVVGVAVAAAASASAQVYAGAGYTQLTYEQPTALDPEEIDFGAVTGRAGFQFSPFFAIEGEASFGLEGGETPTLGLPPSSPGSISSVDLDRALGGFAVARLPVPFIGDVFARGGFGNVELEVESIGITNWDDVGGSGLAYGAGVELNVFPFLRGRIEYTMYDVDEGFDSFSASILARF